jgi:SSS family solute:Na+ symporter
MVAGGVALSLYFNNILDLIKYIWQLPVIFGAVFWMSILWRRVTKTAALLTVCYSWLTIVFLPNFLPALEWTTVNSPYVHLFSSIGLPLQHVAKPVLMTLTYGLDVIIPFLLLAIVSLSTKPLDRELLDPLYARFHTAIESDPDRDKEAVAASVQNPSQFDNKKWLPHTDWEMMKPSRTVFWGFIGCFGMALAVLGFAFLIANVRWP